MLRPPDIEGNAFVLGSITSLGVGSNLDLQNILDQLREIDAAPLKSLQKQQTTVEARLAEFDAIQASFLTVKSHALDLSLNSSFLLKGVTIANQDVLSATAATGTGNRTDTVEVIRLATQSSFQSEGFADDSASINTSGSDQTFAYKLGPTGDTINLTVTDGTTLKQLAGLINDDPNNPGVTASILDDGSGDTATRLLLQAKNSGEKSRITIVTPLTDIDFTEIQGNGTSLNAALKVNGITYQRQSNTGINDIVQGLSLNLYQTGTTTVQVHDDTKALQDNIIGLVKSMNEVFQDIMSKSAYDKETAEFGPLGSASSLKSLRGDFMSLLSSQVKTGGTITTLFDLGLELNRDGTISLNEATLATALSANLEDATTLFVGDAEAGVTGLADLLNNKLREVTRPTGFIDTEKQASENELQRLQNSIASTTARIDRRYEIMARQFAALDSFASQMQSQGNFLRDMIASLGQQ
jgi:flagellar hook-associated protein 2